MLNNQNVTQAKFCLVAEFFFRRAFHSASSRRCAFRTLFRHQRFVQRPFDHAMYCAATCCRLADYIFGNFL